MRRLWNRRVVSWAVLVLCVLFVMNIHVLSAQAADSRGSLVPQQESDVTYPGVNHVTLAGTLLIPAHPAGIRVPGVVIVAGSGSVDRNGNELQLNYVSDLYKQIAESLAQHGIASLRYDKRGVGASTPPPLPKDLAHPTPAELAALQQFVAWDNYVGDAVATLKYLQQRPEIDARHTILLGHSEGTRISEQIASAPSHLIFPPSALVLIGAPGRPFDVVLREQLANNFSAGGLDQEVTNFILQQYDAIITGIKEQGQIPQAPFENLADNKQVPASIVNFLQGLFSAYNLLYWEGILQLNPSSLVQHYRGPVLVIQGESDHQVFANEDTPLLKAALQSRPHSVYRILLVPNASHDLKEVPPGSDSPGVTGPVVPVALKVLNSWLLHVVY